MKRIIKHEWALSKDARALLVDLIQAGFDPDLAISIMEQSLPEDAVYRIDEEGVENE